MKQTLIMTLCLAAYMSSSCMDEVTERIISEKTGLIFQAPMPGDIYEHGPNAYLYGIAGCAICLIASPTERDIIRKPGESSDVTILNDFIRHMNIAHGAPDMFVESADGILCQYCQRSGDLRTISKHLCSHFHSLQPLETYSFYTHLNVQMHQ